MPSAGQRIGPRPGHRIILFVALLASAANAQLPSVSPGPLSNAHAKSDSPAGCTQCHNLSGSTVFTNCLNCHTHQPLKNAIDGKHGLHASFNVPCQTCHFEHKGREGVVTDWSRVGGQTQFNHKATGFVLAGMHEKVRCTRCHTRPSQTGSILFAGVSSNCDACHKNPHQFSKVELRTKCLECHLAGGVRPTQMHDADIPFNHEEDTGIALVGRHAEVLCSKCHVKGKMSMTVVRTCSNCHKSPHVGSTRAFDKQGCPTCHNPARPFKEVLFNHQPTGFSLEGQHQHAACRQCHSPTKPAPRNDCAVCHAATHRNRFAEQKCMSCHQTARPGIAFAHGELTKFVLTARHAETKCRSCHRGKKPWEWEKFTTTDCVACHRHKDAHQGQFMDRACTACHLEGGSKKLTFNHDVDSKFPLKGAHLELANANKCKSCHPGGKFRIEKTACAQCHKDAHDGALGAECQRCHSPETKFKKTAFDHSQVAAFQLKGLHVGLECVKCHPARKYKTGKTHCADCHAATEPHAGKLGTACEKCHEPAKGAPLFVHEQMTSFARIGRHLEAPCTLCHRVAPAGGPPAPGWGKTEPPGKIDLHFPVMGKQCAQCHADKHAGGNGTQCDNCHKPTRFADVSMSVHDTGAFRLGGKHQTLPCVRCHGGGKLLAGTGEACQLCHRDDDQHGNALGPFCGECHSQWNWMPSSFAHIQTSFPLQGAHRTVPCRRCHGPGTFQGLPNTCEGCHAAQARMVTEPLHTAELAECEQCHSPVGFRPARFLHPAFQLVGHHRAVACGSCHRGGVYAGTPNVCESCHLTSYLTSTQPNHQASGYSMACGDCHTPLGWRPARAP